MTTNPSLWTVYRPGTQEVLGTFPIQTASEVQQVVSRARQAQTHWQQTSFQQRRQWVLRLRDLIFDNLDDWALAIHQENGKPVAEALGHDLIPVLDLMTYFAKQTQKLLKPRGLCLGKWNILGRSSSLSYHPYGVVGVIAPWNFPVSIPLGETVMALMAGNVVVLKPSEWTTLVALRIQKAFEEAGFPVDVMQVVTGDGATGQALIEARCDKIAFTGSVPTGKKIMAACSQNLIPVTLELGGKDPLLVFEDADLDAASSAAVWGGFCNAGQVCASVERVLVQDSIYEEFIALVRTKTEALRVSQDGGDLGVMTLESQRQKVQQQVQQALAAGARRVTAESKLANESPLVAPMVLDQVPLHCDAWRHETFGPLLVVQKFSTEDEALTLAHDSDYGLNAYVWTKDPSRMKRMAQALQFGTVNLNESVFSHALPQTPWGGVKQSGLGRTHGALGLMDLVQVRHVHRNHLPWKMNFFWWFPYTAESQTMLRSFATMLFARSLGKKLGAVVRFLKLALRVRPR